MSATTQRPTLPKVHIGETTPRGLISEAQVGGGRVYYARIAAWTVASFGLDASGLGLHARITRTNEVEACRTEGPVLPAGAGGTLIRESPGTSVDTDFGNRALFYPTEADDEPVTMPFWRCDFDRGIWIPKGLACQIQLEGGDPDSDTIAWAAFESHELFNNEPPPPFELTYAKVPDGTTIYLMDRPSAPNTPLPVIPADVPRARTLRTPMQFYPGGVGPAPTPFTVGLNYDDPPTIIQTIAAFPGVPISLAGAVSVTIAAGGQWIFEVGLSAAVDATTRQLLADLRAEVIADDLETEEWATSLRTSEEWRAALRDLWARVDSARKSDARAYWLDRLAEVADLLTPPGVTEAQKEELYKLARFSGERADRMVNSGSGADQADSEAYYGERRIYVDVAAGVPVDEAIAKEDRRWRAYAEEQAQKVAKAGKIKRGPMSGASSIHYRWVSPDKIQSMSSHIRYMVAKILDGRA